MFESRYNAPATPVFAVLFTNAQPSMIPLSLLNQTAPAFTSAVLLMKVVLVRFVFAVL